MRLSRLPLLALSLFVTLPAAPQKALTGMAATAETVVPALVPYSGTLESVGGKPFSAEASVTFLIYKGEEGGEALFIETQTVVIDSAGHYKAQIGATLPSGLPLELFATGEARWLEVQVGGERPQPRVLLASVPYALKAADAATLGGLPASAFVRAAGASPAGAAAASITPDLVSNVTTTGGTSGYVPVFNGVSTVVDSILFQGPNGIGINSVTPASALDVTDKTVLRGNVDLARNGSATASAGANSNAFEFSAQSYSSTTKAPVNLTYEFEAEATGNNTASPGATLNLLYNNGTTVGETGFYFNPNGTINFAPGQTFPGTGTGNGTITGVTAGAALTGGGSSGAVTLNVDTTKVPLLAASNTFTGNQTITGNLGVSGTASAGIVNAATAFDLGGSLFGFSTGDSNTGIGLGALNPKTTGFESTASGHNALANNTTGYANTADGAYALVSNTTGYENTASGDGALFFNTIGNDNTANGSNALSMNTKGTGNTANGEEALTGNTTGNYNTASGYQALYSNIAGYQNTASGVSALYYNSTGYGNTASGYQALT